MSSGGLRGDPVVSMTSGAACCCCCWVVLLPACPSSSCCLRVVRLLPKVETRTGYAASNSGLLVRWVVASAWCWRGRRVGGVRASSFRLHEVVVRKIQAKVCPVLAGGAAGLRASLSSWMCRRGVFLDLLNLRASYSGESLDPLGRATGVVLAPLPSFGASP